MVTILVEATQYGLWRHPQDQSHDELVADPEGEESDEPTEDNDRDGREAEGRLRRLAGEEGAEDDSGHDEDEESSQQVSPRDTRPEAVEALLRSRTADRSGDVGCDRWRAVNLLPSLPLSEPGLLPQPMRG